MATEDVSEPGPAAGLDVSGSAARSLEALQSGEWELAMTLIKRSRSSSSLALSSLGNSSTVQQALHELDSLQCSSSTERLHRLLSQGGGLERRMAMSGLEPPASAGSSSSFLSSLLSALGSLGSAASETLSNALAEAAAQLAAEQAGAGVQHVIQLPSVPLCPATGSAALALIESAHQAAAAAQLAPAPKRPRSPAVEEEQEIPPPKRRVQAAPAVRGRGRQRPAASPPQSSATPSSSSPASSSDGPPGRPAAKAQQHQPKSSYKGVSCHKLTLRWESSLWLNGRQVYLGGFATEEEAARAYDLAALCCKGPGAEINFAPEDYAAELSSDLANLSQSEVIAFVRRRSNAFARGASRYRGVSGREGRWETRIGSFAGIKNVSFGVHDDEQQAARMYDRAMIVEKGRAAKTNFPLSDYEAEVAAYRAFCTQRWGKEGERTEAQQEQALLVSLPLNAYQASLQQTDGALQQQRITKTPRRRKVKAIYAVAVQEALRVA